jgi:hypothetical protein
MYGWSTTKGQILSTVCHLHYYDMKTLGTQQKLYGVLIPLENAVSSNILHRDRLLVI